MEVEVNLKIIKLVQRRPVLYTKCNDFRSRSHQWKEVADILKTEVSLAKSRWHLLRARFIEEYLLALKGNRSSFKYLNDMSFLVDHINLGALEMYSKEKDQYRTQPEFEITKKDLEEASDDDSDEVFVELQIDESNQKELDEIPDSSGLTEVTNDTEFIEPIYIDESPQPEDQSLNYSPKPLEVEESLEETKAIEAEKTTKVVDVSEESCEVVELKNDDLEKPKDKSKPVEEVCQEVSSQGQETMSTNTKPSENFRCEDTIFGELVAATLRQMQSDKKRNVKREIMNILFT